MANEHLLGSSEPVTLEVSWGETALLGQGEEAQPHQQDLHVSEHVTAKARRSPSAKIVRKR